MGNTIRALRFCCLSVCQAYDAGSAVTVNQAVNLTVNVNQTVKQMINEKGSEDTQEI